LACANARRNDPKPQRIPQIAAALGGRFSLDTYLTASHSDIIIAIRSEGIGRFEERLNELLFWAVLPDFLRRRIQ
jgi:hypothetical protein